MIIHPNPMDILVKLFIIYFGTFKFISFGANPKKAKFNISMHKSKPFSRKVFVTTSFNIFPVHTDVYPILSHSNVLKHLHVKKLSYDSTSPLSYYSIDLQRQFYKFCWFSPVRFPTYYQGIPIWFCSHHYTEIHPTKVTNQLCVSNVSIQIFYFLTS